MGGAGSIQHRHGLLRPAPTRPLPRCSLLGGRGRGRRGLHLPGFAARGKPALQRARRPGRETRRPRSHHSAAASGNGDRAHRLLPDGRGGDAAFSVVRSGCSGIPSREQRNRRRARRSRIAAQSGPDSRQAAASPARDRRCGRAGILGAVVGEAPRQGFSALHSDRYGSRGTGAAHLYQWYDGSTQRSAYAAAGAPRQSPRVRAFARSFSAGGRPVLVAGGLGLDGRPDGRAAAVALPRDSGARVPRTLRSGKVVLADAKVRRAQQLSLSDRAQGDDEGCAAAGKALPAFAALHHERRRIVGRDGIRMDARSARGHRQRDVRPDRNELHRRQFAYAMAGQARVDRPAVSRTPGGLRRRRGRRSLGGRTRRGGGPGGRRPGFFSRVLEESRGDAQENHRRMVPYRGPRETRRGRRFLVPGPRRRHVQERGLPHRSLGDRELPGETPRGRELRRGGQPRSRAHPYREGIHRAHPGVPGFGGAGGRAAAARARQARALRVSEGDRIPRQPADDHDRQGAAAGAAAARRGKKGEEQSMNVDLIGAVAGTLSTIAFIPQVWRIWKTRSARDLSLPMYLIFTSGVALWFVYGLLLGAVPIIVCNGSTLALAGTVLAMKLKFG